MANYAHRSQSAASPDVSAVAAGTETVRQQRYGNAAAQEQLLGSTAEVAVGPPLPLQFDAGKLSKIPGLQDKLSEWQRLHLKDGAVLSVGETLALTANFLQSEGFEPGMIHFFIGQIFFGSNDGSDRTADNLSKNAVHFVLATPGSGNEFNPISPVPCRAYVAFSNGANSSFAGPQKYRGGLDTNERESRVGLARRGSRDGDNRAQLDAQSMVRANWARIQALFIADDVSEDVRDKVGQPEFNALLRDYIYDRVLLTWPQTVAAQRAPLLANWVRTNPAPSPVTPAWAQAVGAQAMSLIVGYTNTDIFAWAHTTWYIEDEAAAQVLVESVVPGLSLNFDVDAPGNIRIQ